MSFNRWIDTLVSEKNIDLEQSFEFEDSQGVNHSMPYQVVVDAMKIAGDDEQKQIKDTIVKIDFANGDILHFFRHLGKCLAEVRNKG